MEAYNGNNVAAPGALEIQVPTLVSGLRSNVTSSPDLLSCDREGTRLCSQASATLSATDTAEMNNEDIEECVWDRQVDLPVKVIKLKNLACLRDDFCIKTRNAHKKVKT